MTWHFQEADEDFAEIQAGGTLQPTAPSLQPTARSLQPTAPRLQPVASSLQPHRTQPCTLCIQAGDLQAHLVKVCGNAPVEVGLDMKRVEVRDQGYPQP